MNYPVELIDKNISYYALTWGVDKKGLCILSGQTHWVGFADSDNRIELRCFSTVDPMQIADYWTKGRMPFCVVNTNKDYEGWYITGGNALVAVEIAKRFLPDAGKPSATVQVGSRGFTGTGILPAVYAKPAPTPKMRMRVMKRDKYRCRICGRSPDANTDIELHTHHIRPFGKGGVTDDGNLITLCSTCHKGLEPHYEWELFNMIENPSGDDPSEVRRKNYYEDVGRYRMRLKLLWAKIVELRKHKSFEDATMAAIMQLEKETAKCNAKNLEG